MEGREEEEKSVHVPVLLEAALSALSIVQDGIYIDATLGRGGHTQAILRRLGQQGRLLSIDCDPAAIASVSACAWARDMRLVLHHGFFADLGRPVSDQAWTGKVNGILMDLGVSSPQLDTPARGFSFRHDGPLDMRMNMTVGEPVSVWLNAVSALKLTEVLRVYGEERYARRIANAIIAERKRCPIQRTQRLVDIIQAALPRSVLFAAARPGGKHPATRTFQALRIHANNELHTLSRGLEAALRVLAPGGRLVVITFHSLERKIVKHFIQHYQANGLVVRGEQKMYLKRCGRPYRPSQGEQQVNRRSRSAIMYVAQGVK